MVIAPFASAFHPILYNYAVKLLLDLFTQNEKITFAQGYKPIIWFVMAQAILDVELGVLTILHSLKPCLISFKI